MFENRRIDDRPQLSGSALHDAAARVLHHNDRGGMTVASPSLYPHQWSWDTGFVAIGIAHLSVERACVELDHLLSGQWRTGMIPHIVFSEQDHDSYFPGPARWGCAALTDDAPARPATSGISQPAVHAIALGRMLDVAAGRDRSRVLAFAARSWPALLASHRWTAARRSVRSGLVMIVHGWESGMDNSPRFDAPYSRVVVGASLPPYERTDLGRVSDAGERPTHRDYDRYLWLIEELRAARYDHAAVSGTGSFCVGDVFTTAILAAASDVLADVGEHIDAPGTEIDWLRWLRGELQEAVVASVDPTAGLAADVDERTGERLPVDTIAGFAPLVCGGLDAPATAAMIDRLEGSAWCGHPGLFAPSPPSTTPTSPRFERTRYWRGPVWPVMVWLFHWALTRRGNTAAAERLRAAGLRLVADGTFGEYYEPFTGTSLGSADQSWTAAVALDWLAARS